MCDFKIILLLFYFLISRWSLRLVMFSLGYIFSALINLLNQHTFERHTCDQIISGANI